MDDLQKVEIGCTYVIETDDENQAAFLEWVLDSLKRGHREITEMWMSWCEGKTAEKEVQNELH